MRGREKEGYGIRDFGLLLIRFIRNYHLSVKITHNLLSTKLLTVSRIFNNFYSPFIISLIINTEIF